MKRIFTALACAFAAAGCASQSKYERYEPQGARNMGSDSASRMGSDAPARAAGPFWSEHGYLETDAPTADSDRRICDEFRRRIARSTFSPTTKDTVRCSCEKGRVVIRGVTQDIDEYDAVYHIGREVAGADNVVNQLDEPIGF